jgi:hypothetical protein
MTMFIRSCHMVLACCALRNFCNCQMLSFCCYRIIRLSLLKTSSKTLFTWLDVSLPKHHLILVGVLSKISCSVQLHKDVFEIHKRSMCFTETWGMMLERSNIIWRNFLCEQSACHVTWDNGCLALSCYTAFCNFSTLRLTEPYFSV